MGKRYQTKRGELREVYKHISWFYMSNEKEYFGRAFHSNERAQAILDARAVIAQGQAAVKLLAKAGMGFCEKCRKPTIPRGLIECPSCGTRHYHDILTVQHTHADLDALLASHAALEAMVGEMCAPVPFASIAPDKYVSCPVCQCVWINGRVESHGATCLTQRPDVRAVVERSEK